MPRITFTGREGELRLYNAGTPRNYLKIPFASMDFSGASARPRPPDPIELVEGGYQHTASGNYEQEFFNPVDFSFSCQVDERTNSWKLRDAMCNPDMDASWKVGTDTWSSTKGKGSIILPDGTFVRTQPHFYDTRKVAVDTQILWNNAQAGSAWGLAYEECYFSPEDQNIRESSDGVELAVRGLCYGNCYAIGAFSAGTES